MDFIEQNQEIFFGKRYRGASISRMGLPGGCASKIQKWNAENLGNFLVVLGPPGSGKTYLCAALYAYVAKSFRTIRCYHERELLQKLRHLISGPGYGDYLAYLHYLTDDDLIILDDVGSSGFNEWREEVIFEFVDYRYNQQKATIITSNLAYDDFDQLSKGRIASRLFADENTILDFSPIGDLRKEGK